MNKSERLNQELIFLSRKSHFQLKDLMQEFSISKRTALRDIQALEQLGLALYAESGRSGGYHLLQQNILTPIYFSRQELTAIFFALQALNQLTRSPFERSFPHIFQKLLASLSHEEQEQIERTLAILHYHNIAPVAPTPYLEELIQSILDGYCVEILYTQYQKTKEQVQFYDLTFRQGVWFLNGYHTTQHCWKIYRADYIASCQKSSQQKEGLSRAQLQASLEAFEKNYLHIPFKCQLTPFGKELFLRNHYRDMTLHQENGQDFIIGHYNEEELDYMVHYLIEFGKHITILTPEPLKQAYLKEVRSLLKAYEE